MKRNLFYLIFTPAFLCLMSFLLAYADITLSDYQYEMAPNHADLSMVSTLICIFFGAFGTLMSAIAAFTNFRFLYNRRKVDYFQSLPIRRSTQFICAGLPHILSLVIGFVFSFAAAPLAIALMLPKNLKVIFDYKAFFLTLFVTLLAVIATFLLYTLLAVSAGKAWHYILLALLASTAEFGLAKAFCLPSRQIAGMGMKPASLASVFVPAYAVSFSPTQYGVGYAAVIIGMVLCAAAFFLLGIWQYNKRDNECAAFRVNGKLAIAIITGGVALNTFFFMDKPSQFGLNILIGVSASLIIFVLSGLIFYKKAFQKLFVIEYGCMCACMVVLLCVCGTNGFGWSDRLPTVEQIDSVTVTNNYTEQPSGAIAATISDIISLYDDTNESEKITLKQADSFEKVLDVNRLANKEFRYNDSDDIDITTIKFQYHLKSGKTVSRSVYYPYFDSDLDYYARVCATKEARNIKITKYSPQKYFTAIDFGAFGVEGSEPILNDSKALQTLYEAYLNLDYEDAVAAYSNDVDNIDVYVEFFTKDVTKKPLRDRFEDAEYAEAITLHFPYSAQIVRDMYMKASDISGTAALKEVNENNVHFIYYGELTEDYSDFEILPFSNSEAKETICLHYGGGYLPENIFGKIPMNNEDALGLCADMNDPSHSKEDLHELLKNIQDPAPTLLKNANGSYGYAVCFVLNDKRITPLYYVSSVPASLQENYDELS